MICERCHRERDSIKALRFAPKTWKNRVGYLKFCTECYRKKQLSDAGFVLCILAVIAVFSVAMILTRLIEPIPVRIGATDWNLFGTMRFGPWSGFIIGTIRWGARVALFVGALRLALSAAGRIGSKGISKWIWRENRRCCLRAAPRPRYENAGDKMRSLVRMMSVPAIVSAVILSSWFCFFEFGDRLSNGKDPHDYTVITQHAGGTSDSRSASLIDVDPHPFFAFLGVIVVTWAGAWLLKAFGGDLLDDACAPTKQSQERLMSEFQANRLAAGQSDRKVYSDPKFTQVETTLTGRNFDLGCHPGCSFDIAP
jgi:hypothetical protein